MSAFDFFRLFALSLPEMPDQDEPLRFEALPEDVTEDEVIAEYDLRFYDKTSNNWKHTAMGNLAEYLKDLGHHFSKDGELTTAHKRFTKDKS